MNYEYYEIIAADLFKIKPESLWMRSREAKVSIPRQFCMKYRNEVLMLSQAEAAGRYYKEHSTLIHGNNKIKNLIETKDKYGKMYLDFLDKCIKEKQNIERTTKEYKEQFLKNIETNGWGNYLDTLKESFDELIGQAIHNENEDNIRTHIDDCLKKLEELKFLYQLEDEQKL